MSIAKIQEAIRTINEEVEKLRAEQMKLAKPALAQLIDVHPDIIAIRWTQYTPYFNDGDVCEFGVNTRQIYFKGGEKALENPEYEDDGQFVVSLWSGGDYEQYLRRREQSRKYYQDHIDRKQLNWRKEPYTMPQYLIDPPMSREHYEAATMVSQTIGGMENVLQAMLGDHVEVTITRDGVKVSDYNHD